VVETDKFEIPECILAEAKAWIDDQEEEDDLYTDPWDPSDIEVHLVPSGACMLVMPFDLPPSVDDFIHTLLDEEISKALNEQSPYSLSILSAKLTYTFHDLYEKKLLLTNLFYEEDTKYAMDILQDMETLATQSEKCQDCGKSCGQSVMRSAAQKYIFRIGAMLSHLAGEQGLLNTALAAQEFQNLSYPISKDLTATPECTKSNERIVH